MTTVRIPVRVRIEVAADRADERLVPLVTDAVEAALGRAVRHAREVHAVRDAVRRTGLRAVPAVDVCFTGDALPEKVASGLERSLRLSAALAAARLTGPAVPRCDQLPEPDPAEPRDDRRVDTDASGAWIYRVPYYDQDGADISLRLNGVPGDQSAAPPMIVQLSRFTSPDDLLQSIADHPQRPAAGQFIVAYGSAIDNNAYFAVVDQRSDGALRLGRGAPVHGWSFPGGEGNATQTRLGFIRADRWQRYGHATNATDVLDLWTEVLYIEAERTYPGAPADELRTKARARALRLPKRDELTLYQLSSGGIATFFVALPPTFPAGPLDVLVLSEEEDAPEDAYGHDCDPLDAGDPGVWAALQGLFVDRPSAPRRAFYGEPAIDDLAPDIAERLRARVKTVADAAHTSPEPYAGGFLLAVLADINRRCRRLTSSHAPLTPQLVEMAHAFGPIRDLYQEYVTVIRSEDDRRALPCPVRGHAQEWTVAFGGVFESARDDAVAAMFVATCQDILLQTLFATHHALHDRMVNFRRYMVLTRTLLLVMLSDTADLMALRDALSEQESRAMVLGGMVPGATAGGSAAWLTVSSTLVDAIAPEPASHEAEAGTVRATRAGWRVYDGKGRWWSRAELEALIAAQRQQATAVDALLDKVCEVDDLVRKLRRAQQEDGPESTDAVDDVFRELLADLLKENEKRTRDAALDRTLAFGLANFGRSEDVTNELGATLSGIHKLAAELLEPAFTDHDAYVSGVARLAAEEIGKAEVWEIVNLVGITALAILCPPAAFVVGAAQAIDGLSTAYEHRGIQRAMLDGDAILSKAQVEAEMWSAWIGAALTVLPELPSVARGAGSATRALVRGEAGEVAAAATRQAMQKVVKHLAELSLEHFTVRFAKELTQAYLINLALSKAMNRVAEAVAQQASVTGRPVSATEVFSVLGRALGDS